MSIKEFLNTEIFVNDNDAIHILSQIKNKTYVCYFLCSIKAVACRPTITNYLKMLCH